MMMIIKSSATAETARDADDVETAIQGHWRSSTMIDDDDDDDDDEDDNNWKPGNNNKSSTM